MQSLRHDTFCRQAQAVTIKYERFLKITHAEEESSVFKPFRRKIQYEKVQDAPIQPLISALSLHKDAQHSGTLGQDDMKKDGMNSGMDEGDMNKDHMGQGGMKKDDMNK